MDFIQYVKIAQDIHLQNYLGSDLYEYIENHIIAGTLSGHYQTLVETYCKPVLIHWAMVEYLPYGAYSINNKGIFKGSSETAETVDKTEVDFLIEKERNVAQYYTERFIEYMSFNAPSKFNEYYTNNNENVYPDKDASFEGWVL